MVDYIINENGVERKATEQEKADIIAKNKAWEDDTANRQLSQIREIRNQKLSETDYFAMSDNTMSDEMKAFRKSMRDIPQNYSEADYDNLLARNEQGNLTHSVWSKP
jgi:homoaconitase/3-isopropylmalate dehydratase large subunit